MKRFFLIVVLLIGCGSLAFAAPCARTHPCPYAEVFPKCYGDCDEWFQCNWSGQLEYLTNGQLTISCPCVDEGVK